MLSDPAAGLRPAVPWGLGGGGEQQAPPTPPVPRTGLGLPWVLWGNGQAALLLHKGRCFNAGNDIKSLISHKNSFLMEKNIISPN